MMNQNEIWGINEQQSVFLWDGENWKKRPNKLKKVNFYKKINKIIFFHSIKRSHVGNQEYLEF